MPHIQIGINLSDRLGLNSVTIDYNDTGLPDNSETIEKVAFALIKAIYLNKESVTVQDLLNELGIERQLGD